jgi:hypothetical protein
MAGFPVSIKCFQVTKTKTVAAKSLREPIAFIRIKPPAIRAAAEMVAPFVA